MSATLLHYTFLLFNNEPPRPLRAIVVNGFIAVLIVVNVLAVILQSVPELNRQYALSFRLIELVSALIFTAEWILRVWSSVERPGLQRLTSIVRTS